ncbi:MAG: exodeoxyribonuclease VII small subunit [Sterolibacterium sp.]
MVKPARNTYPAHPASFEAALAEIETIVRDMEAGQLPLEDSLAAYERGAALLRYCQETLTAAERKLQILEKSSLREFEPPADQPFNDKQET